MLRSAIARALILPAALVRARAVASRAAPLRPAASGFQAIRAYAVPSGGPSDDLDSKQLAEIALKLQSSPTFLRAVADFQEVLTKKGLGPEEMQKPSLLTLGKVLADAEVREKVAALAKAMNEAGVSQEEIQAVSKRMMAGGLFGGALGGSGQQ